MYSGFASTELTAERSLTFPNIEAQKGKLALLTVHSHTIFILSCTGISAGTLERNLLTSIASQERPLVMMLTSFPL